MKTLSSIILLVAAFELSVCKFIGADVDEDHGIVSDLSAKIDTLLTTVKKMEDQMKIKTNPDLLRDNVYHFQREKSLLLEIAQTQSLLFQEVQEQAQQQREIFDEILRQSEDGKNALEDFRSQLTKQTRVLKTLKKKTTTAK